MDVAIVDAESGNVTSVLRMFEAIYYQAQIVTCTDEAKTFPPISTLAMTRYALTDRIRWIALLDRADYRKVGALEVLKREFGYKLYPQRLYESIALRGRLNLKIGRLTWS